MKGIIVTLTGPTCSGKSTLEALLRNAGFASLTSTTTRAPRAGEANGQHYHFIDREEFFAKHQAGDFIEVVEFNGNYYGVTAAECERAFAEGKPVVVVVEPEGCSQISEYCRQNGWRHLGVFVDISTPRQLERFFTRTAKDYAGREEELSENEIETLQNRLKIMLKNEQIWRKAALSEWYGVGKGLYPLFINRFDETTEESAVRIISNAAGLSMVSEGQQVKAAA